MKKNIKYLAIVIVLTFSCKPNQNSDKEFINSFVQNIILEDNYDFNSLHEYISFDENVKNDKKKKETLYELVSVYGSEIKDRLTKCNKNFELLSYDETSDRSLKTKLEYNNYEKVYNLICDEKILTSIILDNNKIISFFPAFAKKQNNTGKHPYLLNN